MQNDGSGGWLQPSCSSLWPMQYVQKPPPKSTPSVYDLDARSARLSITLAQLMAPFQMSRRRRPPRPSHVRHQTLHALRGHTALLLLLLPAADALRLPPRTRRVQVVQHHQPDLSGKLHPGADAALQTSSSSERARERPSGHESRARARPARGRGRRPRASPPPTGSPPVWAES